MNKSAFLVCIGLWLSLINFAGAHPADDYQPKDLPEGYGPGYGYPAEYNYGELVFTQDFPNPWELTAAEKYIIAGASSGNRSLRSWADEVFMLLLAYHSQYGEVPTEISPEIMQAISPSGEVNTLHLEVLKSPITGEYLRTDAAAFERGQVYCRFLTDAEMQHIAELDEGLRSMWFAEEWNNPATGELEPLHVRSRPMLVRIYGETGVIYEHIQSLFSGQP